MRNSAFSRWLKRNPLNLIGSASVILLAGVLLLYNTNLGNGMSSYELNAVKHLSDLQLIISQPFDVFYYLIAKVLSLLVSVNTALELTSFMFAILTLVNFRFIMKYWYDERTANLGTLLLGSSFWFLSLGKVAGPAIMPAFWLSTILMLIAWRKYTKLPKVSTSLLVLTLGTSLYTPHFIWVLIALGLIMIKVTGPKNVLKKLLHPLSGLGILFIAPLIYISFNEPILKDMLGAYGLQYNPIKFLETVFRYVSTIAIKAQLNPSFNLGRLPLLNIFEVIMLALGIVTVYKNKLTMKGLALLGLPALTILLFSIYQIDQLKLTALMPILYILVSIGLNEFMHQWLKGFPKNPFGRSLGLILCVILISLSGYFNVHKYFRAWANNPDTKAAHQLQ